jgi:hypothetical protein
MLVPRPQALSHSGDLEIAGRLPEASMRAVELQDFRASISEAGYTSFGARVGKHDDLVLALAIRKAVSDFGVRRGSEMSIGTKGRDKAARPRWSRLFSFCDRTIAAKCAISLVGRRRLELRTR